MNFSPVRGRSLGYDHSPTLPQRRLRRRMGVRRCPTSACCPRTPASASTTSATSSTASAGSSAPAPPGVTCPRTSRPGRRSTSRPAAGWPPAASRRSSTTSAPSSASPTAGDPEPTAAIFDSRTLQSTPESGGRAGYDGYKRRKGSKVHMAVDTLGHLLALHVTPADEQDRDQVAVLAEAVQEVTGESVELAYVDQGYTGDDAGGDAAEHGIDLEVVKLPEAKRGFVLLPRRWVVERSFGWMARFRRLAEDYERLDRDARGAALRRLQLPDAPQGRPAVLLEFIALEPGGRWCHLSLRAVSSTADRMTSACVCSPFRSHWNLSATHRRSVWVRCRLPVAAPPQSRRTG